MAVYAKPEELTKDFIAKNRGRRIVTEIGMDFYDLVLTNGMEEMEDITDERLGVELEDLQYRAQGVRQGKIIVQVTGVA